MALTLRADGPEGLASIYAHLPDEDGDREGPPQAALQLLPPGDNNGKFLDGTDGKP